VVSESEADLCLHLRNRPWDQSQQDLPEGFSILKEYLSAQAWEAQSIMAVAKVHSVERG